MSPAQPRVETVAQGSREIVFIPLYGKTLAQRSAPLVLGLGLALSFFLVLVAPDDWRPWPAFLIFAIVGFFTLRRPRRIRFGTWIVLERVPFPPVVFSHAQVDRVLSALPPIRNGERLQEIVEAYQRGEVPIARAEEQDLPNPRNALLWKVVFPWGLLGSIALLAGRGWDFQHAGACIVVLYCALRLWDERYRGGERSTTPTPRLAQVARWNAWVALLAAVALAVWLIRRG